LSVCDSMKELYWEVENSREVLQHAHPRQRGCPGAQARGAIWRHPNPWDCTHSKLCLRSGDERSRQWRRSGGAKSFAAGRHEEPLLHRRWQGTHMPRQLRRRAWSAPSLGLAVMAKEYCRAPPKLPPSRERASYARSHNSEYQSRMTIFSSSSPPRYNLEAVVLMR